MKSDSAATSGVLVEQVIAKSKTLGDVVAAQPGPASKDGSTRLVSVIPKSGPATEETAELVKDLRTR